MPSPGELAVQVKGVGLHRTHLHLADVEAFWPTVRHAIHFFRPLTQTAAAREKHGDLSLRMHKHFHRSKRIQILYTATIHSFTFHSLSNPNIMGAGSEAPPSEAPFKGWGRGGGGTKV